MCMWFAEKLGLFIRKGVIMHEKRLYIAYNVNNQRIMRFDDCNGCLPSDAPLWSGNEHYLDNKK